MPMTRKQRVARRAYVNRARQAAGLPKLTTPISMKRGRKLSAGTKQKISRSVKRAAARRKSQNIKPGQIMRTKLVKMMKAMKAGMTKKRSAAK